MEPEYLASRGSGRSVLTAACRSSNLYPTSPHSVSVLVPAFALPSFHSYISVALPMMLPHIFLSLFPQLEFVIDVIDPKTLLSLSATVFKCATLDPFRSFTAFLATSIDPHQHFLSRCNITHPAISYKSNT